MFLGMTTLSPARQATLARRIATGLPVWAVAEGCGLPRGDVGALMWDPLFREKVGSWAEVLDMEAETRRIRLEGLAKGVVEQALGRDDLRAAFYIKREYARGRDPVLSLAGGFSRNLERERAFAEREMKRLEAAEAPAAEPTPAPSAVQAAVAGADDRMTVNRSIIAAILGRCSQKSTPGSFVRMTPNGPRFSGGRSGFGSQVSM